jgi:hypothetical protein
VKRAKINIRLIKALLFISIDKFRFCRKILLSDYCPKIGN